MNSETQNPWDEVAADWDRDAGPRAYAAAAFDSLRAGLTDRSMRLDGLRVLDFGAGTGLLTELIEPHVASIVATDTSPAMRGRLAAKAAGWPTVTVAEQAPDVGTGAAPFDLILCSSVLGFVDDYPTTTAELVARLAPGGLFVQWDWERQQEPASNENEDAPHGLTRAQITTTLNQAGLAEVEVKTGFELSVDTTKMRPLMATGIKPPQPIDAAAAP